MSGSGSEKQAGVTGENGPTVNPDGSLTFIYKSDFDENGILYYIGTDGLTTDYTNPAEGSRVIVERSSDGAGVPSSFVGRESKYTSTDYKDKGNKPFFQVDMGLLRRVYPVRYTVRHGSKMGWLRMENWTFEGSIDGKRWFTLRKHTDDESLPASVGYGTYSFEIEDILVRKCRFLKITQTKPNSGQKNESGKGQFEHSTLFLSGFEVYGRLIEGTGVDDEPSGLPKKKQEDAMVHERLAKRIKDLEERCVS